MTPAAATASPSLGIFAKTFAGTTPIEVLTQARDAGYDTVQYNMSCSGLPSLPSIIAPEVVSAIRSAMHDTGVGIAALSATYNMIHPDASIRAHGQTSLAVLAESAHALGIPMVTLCSGSRNAEDQWAPHSDNSKEESWRDLLDSFTRAIAVAEKYDVALGVEPEPSNVVASAAVARRLIDELQSTRVGIVLDAANLIEGALHDSASARNDFIARAVDTLADRIILVHAKDRAANGAFVTPGEGLVDFPAYFGLLAAADVHAPVITHGFEAQNASRTADFLRGALAAAAW